MGYLQNGEYKVKFLPVFIVIVIILVFACVISFKEINNSAGEKTLLNLIVMQYNPESLSEKVSLYRIENNEMNGIKEILLSDIRDWNRNLRYITWDGSLVYFQTLQKVSLDKFYCGNPKGDSHDIELFPNENRHRWDIYPVYVEHDLKTGEEKKALLYIFLMTYPPTQNISYRHTNFFQSNIENEIMKSYGLGTLTFFATGPESRHKYFPYSGSPVYTMFKGLDNCRIYDSFNPLMSGDGRFIAFDVAKIQDITDKETNDKIIDNINKVGYYKDKKAYGFDKKKISIKRNGWSILFFRRESPEKPELLVSNYRLYKKGRIPSQIPHKCWSPSSDRLLFVGALEKLGVGNVYSVDLNTKKTYKILDINDTSGEFNPDLEWTDYGLLITCTDKIFFKQGEKEIEEIKLPSKISNLKNARMSPDGSKIMFFGKMNEDTHFFLRDLKSGKMIEKNLRQVNPDNVQASWIYNDRISTIKNGEDFIKYEKMYNFLIIN